MSQMPLAIESKALRKVYGEKVAVKNLDLTVSKGEVFGFLGPNGAGKTTSIKMLLGLAKPTSGSALLFGQPVCEPSARARVGFLPEHFRFHEWMKATEFLDLHGRLCAVPRQQRRRRTRDLLDLVGLSDAAHQRLGTFSKGMLQRIGLAQALINNPDLVFLDEPTSGLDPLGRRMVRRVLNHLHEQGITVFLNSHLLGEVEATCTRVAFIRRGQVISTKSLDDHSALMSGLELRVGTLPTPLVQNLRRLTGDVQVQQTGSDYILILNTCVDAAEIARCIVNHKVDLLSMTPRLLSLEEIFVREIGQEDEA